MITLLYYLITMLERDLLFLHSAHMRRCRAQLDKHFVGYFSFQVMTQGGVELFYDQEEYALPGCWAWVCRPGPRIRFHALAPHRWWEHRYVAFQGPLAHRWWSEGLLFAAPQPLPAPRGDFVARFDRLLKLLATSGTLNQWRAINALEDLLLELAQRRTAAIDPPGWLSAVFQQLSRGPMAGADYALLAQRLGMSLVSLRRKFRQATGIALHAYALQQRMIEARRMLGATNEPIKHIAAQLGFADVYYFTRQFHQFTGVPPATYRRSKQN